MRSRIGDEARPSMALLDQHGRAMDKELNEAFLRTTTHTQRRQLAQAGFATTILWLGWLRLPEVFSENWTKCRMIEPHRGPEIDLPSGVGALFFGLDPETKTQRYSSPDVMMPYKTLSGFYVGKWYHRARYYRHLGAHPNTIFSHIDGTSWTSAFFRKKFLYLSLERQRAAGNPYLRPFHGSPGNSIAAKFWSLHCFHRGARSHVWEIWASSHA